MALNTGIALKLWKKNLHEQSDKYFREISPAKITTFTVIIYTSKTGVRSMRTCVFTCTKRVYGAWEHVYLPVLSFSIHIEQRHVNMTVLFNFWFKTVNNCDTYCVDNLNIPPIMFFVPNITFNGVRIFTRNIYLHCTDISDTGVQMFLRTNDKNN